MKWNWAADSDVGRVRRQNEDAFLADGEAGLFVVADGMGGHAAGEVASRMAVQLAGERLGSDARPADPEAGERLRETVLAANEAIRAESRTQPGRYGMGTTATLLLLYESGRYHVAHVGDSRAYLLREGYLRRLTDDHTYVQQLVDRGRLTDEQARLHPRASLLTRALGTEEHIEIDLYEGSLRPGDRLLLCSDGLTGMLSEESLGVLLGQSLDAATTVKALISAANEAGGSDNITVVVVDALPDGEAD